MTQGYCLSSDNLRSRPDGSRPRRWVPVMANDRFSVWVPGLPGCASQGTTEEEALANVADAVREYMEVAVENAAGMMIREIEVAV